MLNTLNRSGTLTAAQKKEKVENTRLYHKPVLDHMNVADKDFNVKVAFTHSGVKVVGIFPSEFNKQKGFYFEFVDSKLDPTDPERKLWKIPYRENYEDVYNLLQTGSYAVPLSDIEEVIIKKNIPNFNMNFNNDSFANPFDTNVEEEKDDDHTSKMTIRDLAAILWQRPVSRKKWLNELVEQVIEEQNVNI